MRPKARRFLEDVLDAATFIRDATAGATVDHYRGDRVLRQAVERNFEIIGEAVRRLLDADAATAARIGGHAQIIAFRNVLIHGYDVIEDDEVWQVIERDLPRLIDTVNDLLAAPDDGGSHA